MTGDVQIGDSIVVAETRAGLLPELERVPWRPLTDERRLHRAELLWTGWMLAYTIPFVAVAGVLVLLQPLALPVALISLAHAWIIPELYAQRGANVVRPPRAGRGTRAEPRPSEQVAIGLLGDLVGHRARELHRRTGLALERGKLGVWLVGESGALLVRPGGRRVHCCCVRVNEPTLPPADRIAHLLLALREDERGFATVANTAFAGAPWRVRRRLPSRARAALAEAVRTARSSAQ
ncbi:MAG TPA: hypothetical protein VGY97_09900 [Solirubrobacteraceae bacterium]|jgi:hypothetical protein|nr:hypothetical protein [Solirubrobacteraceae bacterium]